MRTFDVHRAGFIRDEELNFESLVLAEGQNGSGARLEITKALSYDDQDRSLGQDTYSLSDEMGATYYGGITTWTLSVSRLDIGLDREASDVLDAEGGYQLKLIISTSEKATIRTALDRLVGRRSE